MCIYFQIVTYLDISFAFAGWWWCISQCVFLWWLRELNTLQLITHANRKNASKLRTRLHQFDSTCAANTHNTSGKALQKRNTDTKKLIKNTKGTSTMLTKISHGCIIVKVASIYWLQLYSHIYNCIYLLYTKYTYASIYIYTYILYIVYLFIYFNSKTMVIFLSCKSIQLA